MNDFCNLQELENHANMGIHDLQKSYKKDIPVKRGVLSLSKG